MLDSEELRRQDQLARRVAQSEFDAPLLLEAGAGTGKTTVLVARIVAWCVGSGWEEAEAALRTDIRSGTSPTPETIAARVLQGVVAITFTEAAAAEMARRVGETLSQLVRGAAAQGLDTDLLRQEHDGGGLVALRSRHLLAQLDRLTASTIHAFCRGLLAQHPLEANLRPGFQVDGDGDLLEEVARETVERSVREAYGTPGDPQALALAAEGVGPSELVKAIMALAEKGVPAEALEEEPFGDLAVSDLRDHLLGTARSLVEGVGNRLDGAPQNRVRKAVETVQALDALVSAAAQREVGGGVAAVTDLQQDVETAWQRGIERKLEDWRRFKLTNTESEYLGDHCTALPKQATAVLDALRHIRSLRPQLLEHAYHVLAPLLRETVGALRRRGAVVYQELLVGARDLLACNPGVRALERRRIRQLLVDEFQDTDAVQCEIVRWLALDGPSEERPGLFLVGDPKQSIYGWRNADLAAYEDFLDDVRRHGGRLHRLSVNFRSAPPILHEVERLMGPLMRPRRGFQPAFEPLIPSEALREASGFRVGDRRPVEHWVSWSFEDGEPPAKTRSFTASVLEAKAVARDLASLRGKVMWGRIAILIRSANDLDIYLSALQEAGVPYAVERDRSYYQRREVMDAAALVRCVVDPADHLALVTALRSPWVGVPDAALPGLWHRGFPGLVTELQGSNASSRIPRLREMAASVAAELPAEIPGLKDLAGWEYSLVSFVQNLTLLRESFVNDPGDVFVEKVRSHSLAEATAAARFLGAWRLANLEQFFRQLAATLDEGGDDQAVLRRLRRAVMESREAAEGRPAESAQDAVQVMTIHRAKGLDFEHVYLVQLHHAPGGRASTATVEAEPFAGGWQLRLFGWPTPGFHHVEERRKQVRSAEQIRLLYVASTRAKERLVLAGKWTTRLVEPSLAESFSQLLAHRPRHTQELEGMIQGLAGQRRWFHEDEDGVRWAFPALEDLPAQRMAARGLTASFAPSARDLAATAVSLARCRSQAEQRMQRFYREAASTEAHRALLELIADGPTATLPASLTAAAAREVGAEVGSAVHRLLANLDLQADPDEELARQRVTLAGALERVVAPSDLARAQHRFSDVLDRWRRGSLWLRFLELRPYVLARELPILLAPEVASGPVGVMAGAVDLLYRDPHTDEVVVADYKTDELEDEARLRSRAEAYGLQGAVYVRAVQRALELQNAPRFELWFLHLDRIWATPD